jgi:tRNA pseudouridine55 synthase
MVNPPASVRTCGCHDVARAEKDSTEVNAVKVSARDGILLVDKPAGKTSHDIVAAVRRELGPGPRRRVGHAGTLDPFATGLLLVLVGRATRVQRYLMALPKRYETIARLGATSTTGDPEGEITITGRLPPDPPPLPAGELLQRPPAYSAVKVAGRRAYERARAGEEVELAARPVTVHRFEQLWRDDDPAGPRAAFAIECSAGTYVRTLVADLGDAYCETLRRTGIGPFDVADADPGRLVGLEQALSFLPAVRLAGDEAARASHGVAVAAPAPDDAGEVLLLGDDGPIAIAEQRGGTLKPVVGFRG